MRSVFADAGYWIAMSNPRDSLHARAKELSRSHQSMRLVTSEIVLTEFLDDFCHRGEFFRKAAVAAVQRLRKTSSVTIIPQTSTQFRDALTLYAARSDKTWSLTDCSSFRIMERYEIREALTHDTHFEQAGFRALLRNES
ncbi:MAG TPA: PIN domain-containing protein [Candidatus Margulisiibacteriota bacterium]|nr:PIN domain-containing protein [Candidatus Margulisiibacteriota bacterium]